MTAILMSTTKENQFQHQPNKYLIHLSLYQSQNKETKTTYLINTTH